MNKNDNYNNSNYKYNCKCKRCKIKNNNNHRAPNAGEGLERYCLSVSMYSMQLTLTVHSSQFTAHSHRQETAIIDIPRAVRPEASVDCVLDESKPNCFNAKQHEGENVQLLAVGNATCVDFTDHGYHVECAKLMTQAGLDPTDISAALQASSASEDLRA